MPGPPASRITDMHLCPMATPGVPPIPHVGGPVITGALTVLTGKLPQARVTDQCVCVWPARHDREGQHDACWSASCRRPGSATPACTAGRWSMGLPDRADRRMRRQCPC